jgi:hypothetical protein
VVEATIESGALEHVKDSSARAPIVLPVLAFSYQALGTFYGCRFSLSHLSTDADELIQKLIGRKLQVRYIASVLTGGTSPMSKSKAARWSKGSARTSWRCTPGDEFYKLGECQAYSGTLCSSLWARRTRSSEYGARRVGS